MQLFGDQSDIIFDELALKVFKHQAEHNAVFKEYLRLISCDVTSISALTDIPLMPIDFFKHRIIKSGVWKEEKVFLSSGTGSQIRSKHYLKSAEWYSSISQRIFQDAGFNLSNLQVLGLLPNYLEAGQSSLVHMVEDFAVNSQTEELRFFLYDHQGLKRRLEELLKDNKTVILFGVTFALLDFAENHNLNASGLKVIFTGGMKNKQEELLPSTIVKRLKTAFPTSEIYSEYGMTELLSQSYADHNSRYIMPATLRVMPKEINDPFTTAKYGKTGLLGMIDLANVDTLSFILTQDLGRVYADKCFEVMGRLSNSDLRGCNLLYNPLES